MDELVAQFQKLEELCSRLEQPDARICDLLLEPPPNQARWANHLDKVARQLEAELTAWRQVDAKMEPCRLRLHEFEIWCWTTSMDRLLWRHFYLWWRGCSRAGSMLRSLMEFAEEPCLRVSWHSWSKCLSDLCHSRRAASRHWLVGIPSLKKQGTYTPFTIVCMMDHLPCCLATLGETMLLSYGLGPLS
jgi:hypothetical protein